MNLTFIALNLVKWCKVNQIYQILFEIIFFFSFFDLIAQNRAYIRIKCIYIPDCDEFKYAYTVVKSKFIRVTNCQNSYQICEIQKFHHNTWVVRPSTKLLRPQNLYDFIIKRIDLHIYDLFGILANNPSFCLSSTAFYRCVCTSTYICVYIWSEWKNAWYRRAFNTFTFVWVTDTKARQHSKNIMNPTPSKIILKNRAKSECFWLYDCMHKM